MKVASACAQTQACAFRCVCSIQLASTLLFNFLASLEVGNDTLLARSHGPHCISRWYVSGKSCFLAHQTEPGIFETD